MPGGDDFGARPIDLHLRGLEALGATFELSHGTIIGRAPRLIGARVVLDYPSVGATENLHAGGDDRVGHHHRRQRGPRTRDRRSGHVRQPDGGAGPRAQGRPTITIEGVETLQPTTHRVIPDRVEAATYLTMLGAAGGELMLRDATVDHLHLLVEKLASMGMRISPDAVGIWARSEGRPVATSVATLPYPGLATDYLPMLVALLSVAEGTSFATENLFAGRFRYVGELIRMGADISVEGHHLVVRGKQRLSGAPVKAFDIRAGAALVVAALAAEGETRILDAHHLARGYDRFVEKLVGDRCRRVPLNVVPPDVAGAGRWCLGSVL